MYPRLPILAFREFSTLIADSNGWILPRLALRITLVAGSSWRNDPAQRTRSLPRIPWNLDKVTLASGRSSSPWLRRLAYRRSLRLNHENRRTHDSGLAQCEDRRHPRPWLNAGAFERGLDPVSVVESHEDQEMLGRTLVAVLILFPGVCRQGGWTPVAHPHAARPRRGSRRRRVGRGRALRRVEGPGQVAGGGGDRATRSARPCDRRR